MQQAIVTCTRAAHLMSIIQEVPNAAALVQVTIACCIGMHCYLHCVMVVVVVVVVCGGGYIYIYILHIYTVQVYTVQVAKYKGIEAIK